MKHFDGNDAENAKLRTERGIGFEDVVIHIEHGDLLDILEHPNPDRYVGQRILVWQHEDYLYLVPFVEDEHSVFLRTINRPTGWASSPGPPARTDLAFAALLPPATYCSCVCSRHPAFIPARLPSYDAFDPPCLFVSSRLFRYPFDPFPPK